MNVIDGGRFGGGTGMQAVGPTSPEVAMGQRWASLEFALRWACAGQGQVLPAADFIEAAKLFDAYVKGELVDKVDSSA